MLLLVFFFFKALRCLESSEFKKKIFLYLFISLFLSRSLDFFIFFALSSIALHGPLSPWLLKPLPLYLEYWQFRVNQTHSNQLS